MSSRSDDFPWTAREELRQWLHGQWRKAQMQYQQHGTPFGPHERGLAVWVEYGRITTSN